MKTSDPIDTHGHTVGGMPRLNRDAPPASSVHPTGGPDDLVPGQSPAEIEAQLHTAAYATGQPDAPSDAQ